MLSLFRWPTQVTSKLSTIFKPFFILLISFFALTLFATMDVNPVSADVDFVEEFRGTGNYGFTANGVGTRGDPFANTWTGTGTFPIDVPATATIIKARLIWTGRSRSVDIDGVQLERSGVDLGVITADLQYLQNNWFANVGQIHESADITGLILPGNHTYTVSDHEHGMSSRNIVNPPNPIIYDLNYGVGIWVVYEDNNEPDGEVVVYQGQDSFFRNWNPPKGPHSEVRCATFIPDATNNRTVDIIHLVSGVDTYDDAINATRLRSVAFWSESGSGALPPSDEAVDPVTKTPSLSVRPNATGLAMNNAFPIQSYTALEWDNFELVAGLNVAAGDEWMCFQIESGDSTNLSGLMPLPVNGREASGMWNLFAIRVRAHIGGAVELVSFDGTGTSDQNVTLNWKTADEVDNYGFNLYRNNSPQLPETPIVFVPSTFSSGETVYSFLDQVSTYGTWYYWLEDIDTEGNKVLHGPIQVSVSRIRTNFLPFIVNTP
ncbi:MAG: hypothetical protein GY943_00475 [Chloroflexi bacterium]|nr:hypothetical protein [Chloroflexota bacterium]